jgi:hypothetical protein
VERGLSATGAPDGSTSVVRHVHGPPRRRRPARPRAARVWAAVSVLLAFVGIAVIAFAPQDAPSSEPVRLDVPLALVPPPPPTVVQPAPGESPPPVSAAESPAPVGPAESPSAGSPSAAGGDSSNLSPLPASRPVRVRIPVLGVTSSVMDLGLAADGSMELPPGAYPVGWYDRSPTPGEVGPSVVVGHVDWAGDRGAFYGLRAMRAGDRVVVDRADGTTATFRVDRVERHAKADFPTGEVYGEVGYPALRLITCGGRFDRTTGDYEDNVIVFARLASTA